MSGGFSLETIEPLPAPAQLTVKGKLAEAVPVPESATVALPPLVVTVTVAFFRAAVVGLNIKGTTQATPGARVSLQTEILELEKSELPEIVTEVTVSPAVPVLLMVMLWAALVVAVCTVPKF